MSKKKERISVIGMKKKNTLILALASIGLLCVGTACAERTMVEEYQENGYKISVTYHANGGQYMSREGVTIMDMFNPDDYTKDANGAIHIKLLEPTSSKRPGSAVTISKSGNFYAGWYATREVKKVNGVPVDAAGVELVEKADGTYVYASTANTDTPKSATPAYEYADPWDFTQDTIDYVASDYKDGIYSLTLYAGWVEDYEFNYYYKVKDSNDDWTLLSEKTTFDYKSVNETNSDKDTIWVPTWQNGVMVYTHAYQQAGNSKYVFPKVEGTTFVAAYLNKDCTQKIEGAYEHRGTLDLETATPSNRVQNIYMLVEPGERYMITNASQIVNNANPKGYYEIQPGVTELDFAGLDWPNAFTKNVFEGKIYTVDGTVCTLKNIQAAQSSVNDSAAAGGLFAQIANSAVLKNLAFENVVYDLSVSSRTLSMQFGLFAGYIDDGATIQNVSIRNAKFMLGPVGFGSGYSVNLVAGGKSSAITASNIQLVAYGEDLSGQYYRFMFDPTNVTVSKSGNVSLSLGAFKVFAEVADNVATKYYYENNGQKVYVTAQADENGKLYYEIQYTEV